MKEKHPEQKYLRILLEKQNADIKIIACIKSNLRNHDYYDITVKDFIENYNVRKLFKWRNFGMVRLLQLAEYLDNENLSMKF